MLQLKKTLTAMRILPGEDDSRVALPSAATSSTLSLSRSKLREESPARPTGVSIASEKTDSFSSPRGQFLESLKYWIASAPDLETCRRWNAGQLITKAYDNQESKLALDGHSLSSLPDCLNALTALKDLSICNNRLISIGPLPSNLMKLMADNNELESLPQLPRSLVLLFAGNNRLAKLPDLPSSLTILKVSNNFLASLPRITGKLKMLMVDHNRLTDLPRGIATSLPSGIADVSSNAWSPDAILQIDELRQKVDVIFSDANLETLRADAICNAFNFWEQSSVVSSTKNGHDWRRFVDEPNMQEFARFLHCLTTTREFDRPALRPILHTRVKLLLKGMYEHVELRQLCCGIGQTATKACADRVALSLDEMEMAKVNHFAEIGRYSEREVFDAAKERFRRNILVEFVTQDRYLKHKRYHQRAASPNYVSRVDQVETLLAYHVLLVDRLELSSVSRGMKYVVASGMAPEEPERAIEEITQRESSAEFLEFLESWQPWQQALERRHEQEFDTLTRGFEKPREAISLKPEKISEDQWLQAFEKRKSREINALDQFYRNKTLEFISDVNA